MRKRRLVTWLVLVVFALAALAVVGCSKGGSEQQGVKGKITASGSTALLPLVQKAKEEFEKKNPGVTVNVSGGGSFTGLKQVAEGAVDIGNSDVDAAKAADLKDADKLVDHKVAIAPFVIIVHPDTGVDSLTEQQLQDIFSGKITNWKEVGGKDQKITIIHRQKSSGSRAVIKDIIMKGKEFPNIGVQQDSNGAVRQAVAQTPGAIGYIDVAYLNNTVKAIKYNGVPYSPENVYSGKYPIWAYEHMYTKGEPQGVVKQFLDFIMSDEFQNNYVEKTGFIPLSKMNK